MCVALFLYDPIVYFVYGVGCMWLLLSYLVVLLVCWVYVFVDCGVVIVGNLDVVGYIMFVYVSNTTTGMSFVYCLGCRGVVVMWPALGVAGFMFSLTRIGPTWVVVVGTGVTRFLVSLQRTRVTYLVSRLPVVICLECTVLLG